MLQVTDVNTDWINWMFCWWLNQWICWPVILHHAPLCIVVCGLHDVYMYLVWGHVITLYWMLCVCVCVCACVHACMCVCVFVSVGVGVCACIHACVRVLHTRCVCAFLHTLVLLCECMFLFGSSWGLGMSFWVAEFWGCFVCFFHSIKLYATFWSLSLYDLHVPVSGYDEEISKLD